MSSRVLYPPVLDSYMPAFQAGESSYCRVYFSLSKFNAAIDFTSVHISVMKQSNGLNVVKQVDSAVDGNMRYRSTGIILNAKPIPVQGEDNLYYVDIYNQELSSKDDTAGFYNKDKESSLENKKLGYEGWIPGWIYKIQIRLSPVDYDGSTGQAEWLNNNAYQFSEWSTICTVKAIGKMDLIIPIIDYNSQDENQVHTDDMVTALYFSTMNFSGRIISEDPSEVLYKYSLKIFDIDENLLEDSGELYSNQYQNNNEFNYLVKYEFQDNHEYKLIFNYVTNNGYNFTLINRFNISLIQIEKLSCKILTIENDDEGLIEEYTSLQSEEEEGRVCLKLYASNEDLYTGNICIRRASSKTKYTEWEDIKIFNVAQQTINSLPVVYDYTIESGIFYIYGVQSIDDMGNRSPLEKIENHIIRNFEYSYLLGENNQQLKLMFNNTMQNYKIQLMESKLETIGGQYPIITRNSALNYRIISINGLISFLMDENKTFTDKVKLHGDIAKEYDEYNNKDKKYFYSTEHKHKSISNEDSPSYKNIELEVEEKQEQKDKDLIQPQYDYIYERDFRQAVLDFLHNGKPKLFKSPTEGNIIVRITDINCVPNQPTSRLIYEFSSTGNEIAEATYENYLKYNFLDPGQWSSELFINEFHIGQLQMDFTPTTNIFYEIYNKYDGGDRNYGGYRKTLKSVQNIKITMEEPPFRIKNSFGDTYDLVSGNNIQLNGKLITIYGNSRIYEFDNRLVYTKNDELYLLGDAEGKHQTVRATIDFIYNIQTEKYQEKQKQSVQNATGTGQIYHSFNPGDSIYDELYYKYYINWEKDFRELNKLTSIEIEANPGTIFAIQDYKDGSDIELHEINDTGVLRLYDIEVIKKFNYIGVRNSKTGEIDETKATDALINYIYVLSKGTYKGE